MDSNAKTLKISCLVCLFAGLAGLIAAFAFALIQGDGSQASYIACAESACAVGAGAQLSRKANLPSNAKLIRMKALLLLLVFSAGLAASSVFLHANLVVLALLAMLVLVAMFVLFSAQRCVKAQERSDRI